MNHHHEAPTGSQMMLVTSGVINGIADHRIMGILLGRASLDKSRRLLLEPNTHTNFNKNRILGES